jgi:hypothetical protein
VIDWFAILLSAAGAILSLLALRTNFTDFYWWLNKLSYVAMLVISLLFTVGTAPRARRNRFPARALSRLKKCAPFCPVSCVAAPNPAQRRWRTRIGWKIPIESISVFS